MTQGALDFLFGLQFFGIKVGLENIKNLLEYYKVDYNSLNYIHIAGTNGKGSTAAILYSIYKESGLKTGLFTSPHLVTFKERIVVGNRTITDEELASYTDYFKEGIEKFRCTFFEATTAIAIKFFIDNSADLVVLETGLGGTLDSTNIVTPLISVITSIDFDHQKYLGNSLIEIARDKGGIIKKGIPIVIGERRIFIKKFYRTLSRKRGSDIFFSGKLPTFSKYGTNLLFENETFSVQFGLRGQYQRKNLSTALKVVEVLNQTKTDILPFIDKEKLQRGLEKANIKGRFSKVSDKPFIITDTAHNYQGLINLKKELSRVVYKNLHIVFGTVSDKDYNKAIKVITSIKANYYFSEPKIGRGLKKAYYDNYINNNSLKKAYSFDSVDKGYNKAIENYENGDLILITGSNFVVGDFYKYYEENKI